MAENRARALHKRRSGGSAATELRPAELARLVREMELVRPARLEVEAAVRFFNEHCRRPLPVVRTRNGLAIEATTLYAVNRDVNSENAKRLEQLSGDAATFVGHDDVEVDVSAAHRSFRKGPGRHQLDALIQAQQAQPPEQREPEEALLLQLLQPLLDQWRQELYSYEPFFGSRDAGPPPPGQRFQPQLQRYSRRRPGEPQKKEGRVVRCPELQPRPPYP